MRIPKQVGRAVFLLVGLWLWKSPVHAQTPGWPSLGGYGGPSGVTMPGMGLQESMLIPYGGRLEGFQPGRMGMGVPLGFGMRPMAESPRRRAGMFTFPDAMTGASASAGRRKPFELSREPLLGSPMRPTTGLGVMPPRIGYPFRQPPSLIAPATFGMGM